MANLAIMASGNGSNFQAIAEKLLPTHHTVGCLIYDVKEPFVKKRAESLGIPSFFVQYKGRETQEAESEIIAILKKHHIDLIALAGFMRILSPLLIDAYPDRIINIHPSLLPKYRGARGIEQSFASNDTKLGVTIHYVNYELDAGPVISQRYFYRTGKETFSQIEERIHEIEHLIYPEILLHLLGKIDGTPPLGETN